MTQTCETCRYWDDRTCWGKPRACTREARRPACSLYRARGEAHVYQEPGEYNIKCTVTEPKSDSFRRLATAAWNALWSLQNGRGLPEALKILSDALVGIPPPEEEP